MRQPIAAAMLAAMSAPASAGTVYYLDIVNHAPSSVVAFDVAPAGAARYRSALPGTEPLPGDGAHSTIAIRAGQDGCLRDVRVAFADGRVLTERGIDICRLRK